MKRVLSLLFILNLILVIGCSSSTTEIDKEVAEVKTQNSSTLTSENSGKEDEIKKVEKTFSPPNFQVKKFEISYKDKKVFLAMKYVFNQEFYKLLKNNNIKYSFRITYSETVAKVLGSSPTEIQEGVIEPNGRLDYEILYEVPLEKELNADEVKLIQADMDYQLDVLNSENKVFHMFPGFRYMVDYKEGVSKEIHYNDSTKDPR
ncbi:MULTISPECIES: hypothetical protein [Paenibacillus]|uniref:hypothetical protein n=1 Tax=Paenibacillus TaxID=44249 RepID=UPI0022B86A55|nr:hypothetical protein [Paenibacillus caseinilyticus]MCZ8519851.1 hypothetical protein [Paenibacillus caseinilyticus]